MSAALDRWVPGLVGLAIWGLPTGYLGWLCWLARQSRTWPSTVGRVVSSRVRHDEYRLRRQSWGIAAVEYEYEVNGRRLRGRRVRFGGLLNANPRDAGRVVIRYTEGSPVSVRYDPVRPHRCTLERRLSRLVWMFLGIGVFQVAAIAGALMGWWN
jgi:hypothetical protein